MDLFLPDSTNAEVPGFTPTEKHIGPVLSNVFRDVQRRIIVASSPRTFTVCSRYWTQPLSVAAGSARGPPHGA